MDWRALPFVSLSMLLGIAMACTGPNPAFVHPGKDGGRDLGGDPPAPDVAVAHPDAKQEPGDDAAKPDTAPEVPEPDTAVPDAAASDAVTPEVAAPEVALDTTPGLPAGAALVDRVLVLPMTTTPSPSFGSAGGTAYTDRCRDGHGLIGYQGYVDNYVMANGQPSPRTYVVSVQAVCAELRVLARMTAVTAGAEVILTRRGGTGGNTPMHVWTSRCPARHVLVGFSNIGASNDLIDNLELRCAPVTVPDASGALSLGTIVVVAGSGGSPTASRMTADCPGGRVAVGHTLGVGSYLDRFRLDCATPSVPRP